jgi:hypothetical protein
MGLINAIATENTARFAVLIDARKAQASITKDC